MRYGVVGFWACALWGRSGQFACLLLGFLVLTVSCWVWWMWICLLVSCMLCVLLVCCSVLVTAVHFVWPFNAMHACVLQACPICILRVALPICT